MNGMKISGLGKAVPSKVLTNDELSQMVDTSDEWISSRTGIRVRHIATTENTTHLAIAAAQEALSTSGVPAEGVGLVIVATVTPDSAMPSTACKVAKALGIDKATCFDLTAACSGFIYASEVAGQFIQTGSVSTALVIGAEVLSRTVDWEDRSTCVLFADGAGAAVYQATTEPEVKIIKTGTTPAGSDQITLPNIYYNHTFYEGDEVASGISMAGKEVYTFATTKVPESIREVLAEAGYEADDIDWYVLHQANKRIMDRVAKHLKVSEEKFFKNLDTHGNTSAASIPMALYDLAPQLKEGDKLILSGFGAGLTWGSMLLEWSK